MSGRPLARVSAELLRQISASKLRWGQLIAAEASSASYDQ